MSEEMTEVTRSEQRKPAARKKASGDDLPPSIREKFAIFSTTREELQELIECNVGADGLSEFDLDRIRIPGGETRHWTIPTPEGEDVTKTIEGVVIHFKDVRAWWPDLEPTGQPPQCWSDDSLSGIGVRFEGDSPSEYHDCRTCPHAAFGTDPKGGKGQWCKQMRALFLLRGSNYLPTAIFLPPTSLRGAKQFFMRLLSNGVRFWGVLTAIDLAQDKNETGQAFNRAQLRVVHRLREDEQEYVKGYMGGIKPHLKRVRPMQDGNSHSSG